MADVNKLAPNIFKWEGGFVNDPLDAGGATNHGVTIATWKNVGYDKDGDGHIDADDIKLLTIEDCTIVLKKYYWDRWKADNILNQSIADILVDWVWGSGKWGIVIPQKILGVTPDGIVGAITLETINNWPSRANLPNYKDLFDKIKAARIEFVNNIVKNNSSQKRFIKGWLNRINDYNYFD